MKQEGSRSHLAWLVTAKIACCGALLLVVTGTLSLGGIGAWLLDGGIAWLGIPALALGMVYLWRRRTAAALSEEDVKKADEGARRGR